MCYNYREKNKKRKTPGLPLLRCTGHKNSQLLVLSIEVTIFEAAERNRTQIRTQACG